MPLPTSCDLELTPGHYCNQPITHFALSADAPEMWRDGDGGNAYLAGFCSRAHADAEPRPTLAAAKHASATVAGMCDEESVLAAWERAIAAYPQAIEIDTAKETHPMSDIDREQLAQDTAEYIANELTPKHDQRAAYPGVTIVYPDDRRPPTTVDDIKAALLDRTLWFSWMDDRVTAAMDQLHGKPTASAA